MPRTEKYSKLNKKQQSGSLANSEPEFLVVGKIGKSHGLSGDVWMILLTDFPERLVSGKRVYIGKKHHEYDIQSFRVSGNRGLLSLKEFHSPEETVGIRNDYVYIKGEQVPDLPEGEYYHHELIGMQVFDENQHLIGVLKEIIHTGANDVYLIESDDLPGKEVLIPAIKEVIIQVDAKTGKMIVRLQEWA
jgi:16S rRNA processing protein RimM